ncbi:hypothetical protein ABZX88_35415 [Kitasatospora aureofaciens]|uniref:hypothetical protein n=1 Tax=Kitasatospora aureofaciens TaxID=1894 RepID=UPI0033AC460B
MPTCEICGTETTQGRARARRTCSPACRQAAHRRRRAAEVAALRAAAAQPPAVVPSRSETVGPGAGDGPAGRVRAACAALAAAADHVATAVEAGAYGDVSLAALRSRYTDLVDAVCAAALPPESSRNEPAAAEPVQARAADPGTGRPESAGVPPAPDAARPAPSHTEPDRPARAPKRLHLPRKKALALLDTAEMVKAEHYQETGTWDVVASDGTVICHLGPHYNGPRRNGWNAWPHGSTPNRHDHYPTRERAAAAGADSWLRIVTAQPRR